MPQRTCKRCQTVFEAPSGTRGQWLRFCSEQCRTTAPAGLPPHGTCHVDGCDRSLRSSGATYCEMHYTRVRLNGDPGPAGRLPRTKIAHPCAAPDCDRWVTGTYCGKHRERVRKHGNPDTVITQGKGPDNPTWRGDNITYWTAHSRVRAERGSASNHPCVGCGYAAYQWSYDHADPNEQHSTWGPFSPNTSHYAARCVTCHKQFDAQYA